MAERLRWIFLGVAAAVLVVFVLAQRQSVEVSYGDSPSGTLAEGAAGELSGATVPSVAAMTAMVEAAPVVRLPGSIAQWDEARVKAAIGPASVRIIVAPPGLDKAGQDRVRAVENATVRVLGTAVSGDIYQASGSAIADWRAQFGAGDVTGQLVALIAGIRKQPAPASVDAWRWRDPTAAELATVTAGLRARGTSAVLPVTGLYVAPGATLTVPPSTGAVFPGPAAKVVVLPRQPYGQPAPHYGPALAAAFPGTSIIVMYGQWIEYNGPSAAALADVAAATFYSQFGDRVGLYSYPADVVLDSYLGRVLDLRYAGLFDRPLPYRPLDPLRVALPALPWLFGLCALVFLALSVRSMRPEKRRDLGVPARLADLAARAFDLSALTGTDSDPVLIRGITYLTAAREALDHKLPDPHTAKLLDAAEKELGAAAGEVRQRWAS